MQLFYKYFGVLLYFLVPLAFAAGGYGGGSGMAANPQREEFVKDPIIRAAKSAIAMQDCVGAQEWLRKAISADPANADHHNLYAFTTRRGPDPDLTLVFSEYAEALRIDPNHRGAHEYLGSPA